MLIVDAHLDLAWNALQWNRDLLCSVQTLRVQEGITPGKGRTLGTVALPEMREGRVALCFATLLARSTGVPQHHLDYFSPQQAYGTAQGQLAYYRALEATGHARIIAGPEALERHIAEWRHYDESPEGESAPPVGMVIGMESADPVLSPDQLGQWREAGLRLIGISHYGHGRYAGGTGVETGLNERGMELLREALRLGILIDMTHFTDRAFWQAIDAIEGPVYASHNNCRALVPTQRQFSDEQIEAIIARGGVIGAALDCWMLKPGWITGHTSNEGVTLETVADHIDHVCQLAGNSRHAGIGSDLDGGFGREQSPEDLDTIADLRNLAGILERRGYEREDVENILWRNWINYLRACWAG